MVSSVFSGVTVRIVQILRQLLGAANMTLGPTALPGFLSQDAVVRQGPTASPWNSEFSRKLVQVFGLFKTGKIVVMHMCMEATGQLQELQPLPLSLAGSFIGLTN